MPYALAYVSLRVMRYPVNLSLLMKVLLEVAMGKKAETILLTS